MLKIATYNLFHGRYKKPILENLNALIKEGSEIICIQEADRTFEKDLRKFITEHLGWKSKVIHTTRGGDLAILWDSKRIKPEIIR